VTVNGKDKLKALLIFGILAIVGMILLTMTDGISIMTLWVGGVIGGLLWGKTLFQTDMEGVKRDEHERIARLIENNEIEDTNHDEQNMESNANHARTRKPF
jgi:hypothetical protein